MKRKKKKLDQYKKNKLFLTMKNKKDGLYHKWNHKLDSR